MSDLIERYVHQVGRHVPQKERAEITAELRSQIQDQLDDRYEGSPTTDNIIDTLKELGDPRALALSYGGAQYLVGPGLYPVMMSVLQRGWIIVPVVVLLVNLVLALFGTAGATLPALLVRLILNVLQALWIFTGIVVAIFAILQHSGEDLGEITGRDKLFDPVDLPEIDDPAGIDKVDTVASAIFGAIGIVFLLHFLRMGGLTLYYLGGSTEVVLVPATWLVVTILGILGQVAVYLIAYRRNRWTMGMLLAELALGLVVAGGLYFAMFLPLFARFAPVLLEIAPQIAQIPYFERTPLIVAAAIAVMAIVESLMKIVKLWFNRPPAATTVKVKAHR